MATLNTRPVRLYTDEVIEVPDYIQRLDSKKNRGWQLRYGKWTYYSDGKFGNNPREALNAALSELQKRIAQLDAPSHLRQRSSPRKSTSLPVGISGPVSYLHPKKTVPELNFLVTIPRFGKTPTTKKAYIGTERTVTDERIEKALAKALQIRALAEEKYKLDATNAKRKTTVPVAAYTNRQDENSDA